MAEKSKELMKDGVKITVEGIAESPILYADNMEIGASFFDFKLNPRVTVMQQGREVLQRQLCSIRMSPPHFKKFVEVAASHLDQYEKRFGPIPTDPISDDNSNDLVQ